MPDTIVVRSVRVWRLVDMGVFETEAEHTVLEATADTHGGGAIDDEDEVWGGEGGAESACGL